MKRFFSIFLIFGLIFLVSCNKSSSTPTTSSVAQLTTFSFAANDSLPGLAAALFSVKELVDTGYVYNEDSILYGTPLNRVVPKFTFAATPGSASMALPDTTVVLSGKDTLDFTRQPAFLTVTSSDGTTTKVYRICAFVHQVDPDLFSWSVLTGSVCTGQYDSRVLDLNARFVMLINNGFGNQVYSSLDGQTWTTATQPTVLPADCRVRAVVSDHSLLYYASAHALYTSMDGVAWTMTDYSGADFDFVTMLMPFNQLTWAVVRSHADDGLYLAFGNADMFTMTDIRLDDDFPVENFAAVEFLSASNRARAMVLGGYSSQGVSLNSRWSFEYSAVEDCYRIQNLTIEQPRFTNLTGAEMVWYDNSIFLFGGIDADAQTADVPFYISMDEGMNWAKPDTLKNKLPSDFGVRQRLSAIVRDNGIYLFGGTRGAETLSDVYYGRLNSINW